MTDEKIVKRIEALLRKAESTNFGPEAESLIAKAHELMARYSIEEAVLHQAQGIHEDVIFIEIVVKKTGALPQERHALLGVISQVSRCQPIITGDKMTIVGYRSDCDYVRMLYESLVLQLMEGIIDGGYANERAKRSFGIGFVEVIRKRLEQVKRDVESEVAPAGSSTALVLRDKSLAVQDKVGEMFGKLGTARARSLTIDPGAYGAGRRAGERADVGQTKFGGGKKEIR